MKNLIVKTIVAAIIGELALALLTTVAQSVLVDGVHIETSTHTDLLLGGTATILAGVLSGMIASLIGGKDNRWPHLIISIFILVETTYLIVTGKIGNPLWFAIVSGLGLLLSIWIGYFVYRKIKARPRPR